MGLDLLNRLDSSMDMGISNYNTGIYLPNKFEVKIIEY